MRWDGILVSKKVVSCCVEAIQVILFIVPHFFIHATLIIQHLDIICKNSSRNIKMHVSLVLNYRIQVTKSHGHGMALRGSGSVSSDN